MTQPGSSRVILIVDDEPKVCAIIKQMLESRGYRTLEADGGEEAVRVSSAYPGPIDLLLTDIVMPGMSGMELAERVRRERPGIRVLFMSGYTREGILRYQGISVDQIPFLQKPFTVDTLARRVSDAIERSKGAGIGS